MSQHNLELGPEAGINSLIASLVATDLPAQTFTQGGGEIAPGVRVASGYSGQGVMLAPYVGKLLAEGNAQTLELMARVPTPPFPGGRWLRWPLTVAGLSWYALRDRL